MNALTKPELILTDGARLAARAIDYANACHCYMHKGRDPFKGLDWLGFLRLVYEPTAADLDDYSPDWAVPRKNNLDEPFVEHLLTWDKFETRVGRLYPGDLLLFRMTPQSQINHGAVYLGNERMAHAYWGRAPVLSRLAPWWRERNTEVFHVVPH